MLIVREIQFRFRPFRLLKFPLSPCLLWSALKAAFVFDGPISDFGWTYSHNLGRLYLGTVLREEVTSEYAESTQYSTATQVGQDFVDRGFKLVFFTGF